ncbi:hypothetical protein I3F58_02920 [Streptomyces sp. MUM 203J]|nr:hypothetical protein [Streptomyces sp. MUM 203J]
MRVWVSDQQVVCPFCRFDQFWEREIKLNTAGMSFLGLDWANKSATGLVCAQCGRIEMFLGAQIEFQRV